MLPQPMNTTHAVPAASANSRLLRFDISPPSPVAPWGPPNVDLGVSDFCAARIAEFRLPAAWTDSCAID
jgi:hypothetical protein